MPPPRVDVERALQYDLDKILLEVETYIPKWIDGREDQIMLQTVPDCDDPYYGTGALNQFSTKHAEHHFVEPMFPGMEYTNSILEEHNLYRTRLLRLKPQRNYTYHHDPTKRWHLPLISNYECFFIIDDEVHKFPADGRCHIIDTTKEHTAINASKHDRIHIVGCFGPSNKKYKKLLSNI